MQKIDHLYIQTSNPEDLLRQCVNQFTFPVAWPTQDYGAFVSGGVSLGNVNLEFVHFKDKESSTMPLAVSGIAFAPKELKNMLDEADRNDVKHGTPIPFFVPQSDGEQQLLWTNVDFPDVLPGFAHVFACAYAFDMSGMNAQNKAQLMSQGGGALGLRQANAVHVSVPQAQFETQLQALHALLGKPAVDNVWKFAAGPDLHLQVGELSIQIELAVADADHAVHVWKKTGGQLPFIFV